MKSVLVAMLLLSLQIIAVQAQSATLQIGDAPRSSQISIQPAGDLLLTITGEAGTVFPSAQVAIRHPYTRQIVLAAARPDGSFSAEITGNPGTPLQVYAARSFPAAEIAQGVIAAGSGAWVVPPADAALSFGTGGRLAYGDGVWVGGGRIDRLQAAPGERLSVLLDADLLLAGADLAVPYTFGGRLLLRPVSDAQGRLISSANQSDWSSFLTAEGLPILGAGLADVPFATATARHLTVNPEADRLTLRLPFSAQLPDDLAVGWYALVFNGQASVADSESFDWYANRVLGTSGTDSASSAETVLPLLLQIGEAAAPRLILSLFDTLALEDSGQAAAANLVMLSPSQPVRPPQDAKLLLDVYTAGLLHSADLHVSVDFPDTQGECALTIDQFVLDGERLRLQTAGVCPQPASYGDHRLRLEGSVQDAAGRIFPAGSSFLFTIAEPLTILPASLPGTVFAPDDTPSDFVQLSPPFPAAWRVDSTLAEAPASGNTSRAGTFNTAVPLVPDHSGVAVVDYSARYLDTDGRLWAGTLRAAYIRAGNADASGAGGLADYARDRQAWLDTRVYPADAPDLASVIQFPFFSSDLALIPDAAAAGIRPALDSSEPRYVAIVRPGLMIRQFVQAGSGVDGRVLMDDLLRQQVGAGSAGLRPGDRLLLFGVVVSGSDLAGYAATAIITGSDYARVVPAFAAPVQSSSQETLALLPTSGLPGQVLETDDVLHLAGYTLPAVPAQMTLEMLAPDGQLRGQVLTAGRYGYFADAQGIPLEQAGIYWLTLNSTYAGSTSAGILSAPAAATVQYPLFVLEADAPPLETTRSTMSEIIVGQSFTINVRLPADWTNVRAFAVARTSQDILEQSELSTFSSQTNYTFDWARTARLFPNLETRASSAADVDEITIILAMTGTDPQGNDHIRARSFTLRAGQLLTTGD